MCSRLLMEEEEENRQHVYNSSSSERVGKRRKKKRGQKSPCCVWKEKEKRKQLLERERREGGRCRVAIGSFSSGCDPCRRLFLFLSDDFLWVYRWCSYNFHHTCRQSSPALPQQQQHKTSSEITKERERERGRYCSGRVSLPSILFRKEITWKLPTGHVAIVRSPLYNSLLFLIFLPTTPIIYKISIQPWFLTNNTGVYAGQ